MRTREFLRIKSLPAKCLLACLLFFSFITIAGNSVNTKRLTLQTFRSELLYSTKEKTAKKAVLSGEYFSQAEKVTPRFRQYNLFNLVTYNRFQKVKVNLYTKRKNSTAIINWLLKIKTVCETSIDNPSLSVSA
jgi:hypothetical protein